jgi:lipid A 3-O-deacylase
MSLSRLRFFPAALLLLAAAALPATAQQSASSSSGTVLPLPPVRAAMSHDPWEFGPFFNGGLGTSDRTDYHFFAAGVRLGKVLTDPIGPGLLRGQFEYAGELMPWWQARTPRFERYNVYANPAGGMDIISGGYGTGGVYNGFSITPILLRWDFTGTRRILPFIQGGGGLIWTNHKFPPLGPLEPPGHQGTSVWNFTPQFGVGFHYFFKPNRSIDFNANAVHISSASLGDANPGVNASVQFQIGYTWWK